MAQDKEKRKSFNDEMVNKTWQYQKEYGFDVSSRQGHEFWNNEADAFKHAFGSAQMAFDFGQWGSLAGGIDHENRQERNPKNEWNMDSWNNNQGREIAKEIQKEFGNDFYKFSQQEQNNIIASKVMQRMRNGQLITNPNDLREYKGYFERKFNKSQLLDENGQPTGFASSIVEDSPYQKPLIFTPEQIGNMSREEFDRNEAVIMEQLRRGEIKPYSSQPNYGDFNNPELDSPMIFTREDIGNMSSAEYTKYEKAINEQLKTVGIPHKRDLPHSSKTYEKEKTQRLYSTNPQNGRWVTINGNHVFIEND